MTDSAEDRQASYTDTKAFFERFGSQYGVSPEQLVNPEARIQLLKNLSSDQFLDILSITNSKLRGEYKRWKRDYEGKDHSAVVTSGKLDSPDLEPPPNSQQEFTRFFDEMKSGITIDNLNLWATKLYAAIIFLHMFSDGNGRLARNAFSFIETGSLANDEQSISRPSLIEDFCDTLNVVAIDKLLKKNGCTQFKYEKQGGLHKSMAYQADEKTHLNEDSALGLVANLKFIAAKRAGILKSRAKNGDEASVSQVFGNGTVVGFGGTPNERGFGELYINKALPWTTEEVTLYQQELDILKKEWFWTIQDMIDKDSQILELWLQVAMKLPNPLFLNINTLIRGIPHLVKSNRDEAVKIFNTDKRFSRWPEDERLKYMELLQEKISTETELVKKIIDLK